MLSRTAPDVDTDPMNTVTSQRALPVQPQRATGKRRFETVLDEADRLLAETGLGGFSIPVLAERLGFTRTSIYKFFPTPYAVLNELTKRYLDRLVDRLIAQSGKTAGLSWAQMLDEMVRTAARFHNANPVGRILILGGAVTDESFRATEYTIQKLGELTSLLLKQRGVRLPSGHPDVGAIAVEVGTAVLRVSHFHFGRITPEYTEEAARAMRAYLAPYAEGA
jgi:AcrR family transcriptional regulator